MGLPESELDSTETDNSRRRVLQGVGIVGLAGFAGCLTDDDDGDDADDTDGTDEADDTDDADDGEDADDRADPEPAFFAVNDLSPTDQAIEAGDSFEVSATIVNTGEVEAEQVIEFRIGDEVLESVDLMLDGESGDRITFDNYDTSDFDDGEYSFGVYSEDDGAEGSLLIGEMIPVFEVSDLDPEEIEVVEGDPFTVSATITNTGPAEGDQMIELVVDGELLADTYVTLDPDDEEAVTFDDVDSAALDPGEFTFAVQSEDDSAEGTITVLELAPNFEVTELDPTDPEVEQGETFDVSATVTNTGTQEGTQEIEYRISAEGLATEELTLDVDEDATVSFDNIETDDFWEGEYIHGVYSEDGNAEGTLTINPAPLSEEQYLWRPEDYDTGESPDDSWEVANAVTTWEIAEDSSGKHLRFGGAEQERSFLRFAEAGVATDTEVWVRIKSDDPESGDYFQYFRGEDDTSSSNDETEVLRVDDHALSDQFRISAFKPPGGFASADDTAGDRLGINHGQSFDVRARVEGDEYAVKWWPANEEEPDGWEFEIDLTDEPDLDVSGPGYTGIGHWTGDDYHVYGFGVGTEGESAPAMSPSGPPMPDRALYDGIVGVHPEDAVETFSVAEGFTIELVASEPLIDSPVDVKWDAAGRMWVCELPDYMDLHPGDGRGGEEPGNWPDGDGDVERSLEELTGWEDSKSGDPKNGAIKVLEDTDGDGVMDTATTFRGDLTLSRSLSLVEDDAVMIAQAGGNVGEADLILCRDTDGDLVFDEEEDLKGGWVSNDNTEHTSNALDFHLDNWIHNSNSGDAFQYHDGQFSERGGTSSYGQWGLTEDDWGRTYHTHNSDLLRGDLGPGKGNNTSNLNDGNNVYPIRPSPGTNRAYGRSDWMSSPTAVSGPGAYRGHIFPDEFVNDVFSPEPKGNTVVHFRLEDQDGGLGISSSHQTYDHTAENNPWGGSVSQADFLASYDEIFKPVNIKTGPDGALYIVDMYNGIFQHWFFLTAYLADYYFEHEMWAIDQIEPGSGRVYRVYPEDAELDDPPALNLMDADELAEELTHENGWVRRTAQRLIVQKQQTDAVVTLRDIAQTSDSDRGRMHAIWTLAGLGELDGDSVFAVFEDVSNSHVLANTMDAGEALYGTDDEDEYVGWLEDFADDDHDRIAQQAERSL